MDSGGPCGAKFRRQPVGRWRVEGCCPFRLRSRRLGLQGILEWSAAPRRRPNPSGDLFRIHLRLAGLRRALLTLLTTTYSPLEISTGGSFPNEWMERGDVISLDESRPSIEVRLLGSLFSSPPPVSVARSGLLHGHSYCGLDASANSIQNTNRHGRVKAWG